MDVKTLERHELSRVLFCESYDYQTLHFNANICYHTAPPAVNNQNSIVGSDSTISTVLTLTVNTLKINRKM